MGKIVSAVVRASGPWAAVAGALLAAGCLEPSSSGRSFARGQVSYPYAAFIDSTRILVLEQRLDYTEECGGGSCVITEQTVTGNDFIALHIDDTARTTSIHSDGAGRTSSFHYFRPHLYFPLRGPDYIAGGPVDSLLEVDCRTGGKTRVPNRNDLRFDAGQLRTRAFVTAGGRIAIRHCPEQEGEDCTVTIRDFATGDSVASAPVDGLPLYLDDTAMVLRGLASRLGEIESISLYDLDLRTGGKTVGSSLGRFGPLVYLPGNQASILLRKDGGFHAAPGPGVPLDPEVWNELGRWTDTTASGFFELDTATGGYFHRTDSVLFAGNALAKTRIRMRDLRPKLH